MKRPMLVLSLMVIIAGLGPIPTGHSKGGSLARSAITGMAVVANGGTERSISVVDPATDTALGPFLEGKLGDVGAILYDVAVTPDGNTAIVSNFTDKILYFVDLKTMPPSLLGLVALSIFPLDLAVSPNGRYVLATSGTGNTDIVSVDVASRTVINTLTLSNSGQAEAVAIAPNGETVLAADQPGARVHVLRLAANGTLAQPQLSLPVVVDGRPTNIAIAPDGRTAVVSLLQTATGSASSDAVTILRLDNPTLVTKSGTIAGLPGFQQGAAFTPDGTKVLVLSAGTRPDRLSILQVLGPGMVSDTGQRVNLLTDTGAFIGIDVLAVAPDGTKAYVGNPGSVTGMVSRVTVVDLTRTPPTVIGSIPMPLPVGIAFPGR